jgi:hypothetical protein
VCEGVWQARSEDRGVEKEHGTGNGRHAAVHHHEELPARQPCEVGLDDQWRLDHAHEHVGRGRDAHRAANAHDPLQHCGEATHDQRQHAPMKQQRRQRSDDQHQGQGAKRQHEARARRDFRKRQWRATEEAKDKG